MQGIIQGTMRAQKAALPLRLTAIVRNIEMKVRLAAVQPASACGAEEIRNATESLTWLRRAAENNAQLVVFPEGYPGPINPSNEYDALKSLANAAAEFRLHVIASRAVPSGTGHAIELNLINDHGEIIGTYQRTTPRGPYVYRDIEAWNFDYIESNSPPCVFETTIGRIGMLVCSELYFPELSRLLMLQGADIIAYPAGGSINELLPGWRTLVHARAIENLVFTVACQNLYGNGKEEGVGTIAGPEGVLAHSKGEGLVMADLDLERLAFLRAEDEKIEFPKRYATIPGVRRLLRPELYAWLVAQNQRMV
jgi:predicted amidohydrolase